MHTVINQRKDRVKLYKAIADQYRRDEAKLFRIAARDDFNPVPDPNEVARLRYWQRHYDSAARRLAFFLKFQGFEEVTVYVQ